ncbi:MAG: hypothetical protein EXR65_01875 [Dehalococcoidia bacterium]|nr:hypothetical protein [Dehalococcoidia bacterium]
MPSIHSTLLFAPAATPSAASAPEEAASRLRRIATHGPRCPDCAGPLVFGEGCHLCPICGYSACGAPAR